MRYLSTFNNRKPNTVWDIMNKFDEAFKEMTPTWASMETAFPAVDIEEKDGNYVVTMDIPGMKKEEINISMAQNTLTVSGERKRESKKEDGHYYERVYGTFQRTFTIPSDVDASKVQAAYENGELKLTLPKTEEQKAKTIKVN